MGKGDKTASRTNQPAYYKGWMRLEGKCKDCEYDVDGKCKSKLCIRR